MKYGKKNNLGQSCGIKDFLTFKPKIDRHKTYLFFIFINLSGWFFRFFSYVLVDKTIHLLRWSKGWGKIWKYDLEKKDFRKKNTNYYLTSY